MKYETQLLIEAAEVATRLLIAAQEFIRLPKNRDHPLDSADLQKVRDRMRNMTSQLNATVKKAKRKEAANAIR